MFSEAVAFRLDYMPRFVNAPVVTQRRKTDEMVIALIKNLSRLWYHLLIYCIPIQQMTREQLQEQRLVRNDFIWFFD